MSKVKKEKGRKSWKGEERLLNRIIEKKRRRAEEAPKKGQRKREVFDLWEKDTKVLRPNNQRMTKTKEALLVPSLAYPHPGQSYNPTATDHQV